MICGRAEPSTWTTAAMRSRHSLIKQIVGFPPRRVSKNRARPQRARTILHPPDVNCAELASIEPPRRARDRIFLGAADVGTSRHRGVDEIRIIAAEIDVPQTMPLRKPVRKPIALQQIAKSAAGRHTFVAHRG